MPALPATTIFAPRVGPICADTTSMATAWKALYFLDCDPGYRSQQEDCSRFSPGLFQFVQGTCAYDCGGVPLRVFWAVIGTIACIGILANALFFGHMKYRENRRVSRLVEAVLPPPIVEEMISRDRITSLLQGNWRTSLTHHRTEVAVLFIDVVGFSAWAASHRPQEQWIALREFFGKLDKECLGCGCLKIKTVVRAPESACIMDLSALLATLILPCRTETY
eukprot:scaffold389_cov382-Prasinococcus_capsulatus_cf.AAC.6